MGLPKNEKEDVRAIRKKIAQHGLDEVEVLIDLPSGKQEAITASRILIALEVLFEKMVKDRNLAAAQQYLDRMLGKPKESLSITDEGEGIGKLSDKQLIEKIIAVSKAVREAGAGDPD